MAGPFDQLVGQLPSQISPEEIKDALVIPGLIDLHTHFPQTDMIASYGEQLLDWLANYTFPTELAFADAAHSREVARAFTDELIRHGTTTALVFGTVHAEAVDHLFSEAAAINMRMIAGKVLMDRNAPEGLLDGADYGEAACRHLIEKWHGYQRLSYALTPRFAPTSSPDQLAMTGRLLAETPSLYLQTHMSENPSEIAWVTSLFPECEGYLDTYDTFNLVGSRSVFAHCIHLTDRERTRLADAGSSIAFCPTSNLFLGSGLFDYEKCKQANLSIGLGTDIGAGTSFSLLSTMGEAYKVGQLRGAPLPPCEAFYMATLGGAKALSLDHAIGTLAPGTEADLVVLDMKATSLIGRRMANAPRLEDRLFALAILGDDRAIARTYIDGRRVK
ncbi:guanine deaminase [Parvularcula bermudensis HTCC2503]|uniref:Guanine deaminase n=2 Tax=Parvularcula TaxID=208215 RepID=E0TCX7_PARBH|nr:guanine deaminase [Parvularcula bermudensis HTCC2503]